VGSSTRKDSCNEGDFLNPNSISRAKSLPKAAASARAMLDWVGCMKMLSGFDLDRGRVDKSGRDSISPPSLK